MATTIDKFDSTGGFSVDKTTVVDELRNAKDLNTLEIKNSNYSDSRTTNYILRGLNTSTLDLDGLGTQVPILSNTINFITAHIIAVNAAGTVYATKFESSLFVMHQEILLFNLLSKQSLRMMFLLEKLGR